MYDGLTYQGKIQASNACRLIAERAAGVTYVVVVWLTSHLLAETVSLRQFCCQP